MYHAHLSGGSKGGNTGNIPPPPLELSLAVAMYIIVSSPDCSRHGGAWITTCTCGARMYMQLLISGELSGRAESIAFRWMLDVNIVI